MQKTIPGSRISSLSVSVWPLFLFPCFLSFFPLLFLPLSLLPTLCSKRSYTGCLAPHVHSSGSGNSMSIFTPWTLSLPKDTICRNLLYGYPLSPRSWYLTWGRPVRQLSMDSAHQSDRKEKKSGIYSSYVCALRRPFIILYYSVLLRVPGFRISPKSVLLLFLWSHDYLAILP